MGRTVYLPNHEWLILMVNVGKDTSPMDASWEKTHPSFFLLTHGFFPKLVITLGMIQNSAYKFHDAR